MKPGVMRTSRSSSARRPSVRCCCFESLAGLKLIVTPDLHGLKSARGRAEETFRHVREALGRVGHVEVVQIIAQKARPRTRPGREAVARGGHEEGAKTPAKKPPPRPRLAEVAKPLRRRPPQALFINRRLDHFGRGLARVYELDRPAQRLLNHPPKYRVVR